VYVYMYLYMYLSMYVYLYVCNYVCMYACIYVCICLYMYVCVLIFYVCKFVQQIPYRQLNLSSANQEIPLNVCKPTVRYRVHNSRLLVTIMNDIILFHVYTSRFSTVFNNTLRFIRDVDD